MPMYAVIQTGGKQYRVQPGDTLYVEKLDGDVGQRVEFDQVLLLCGANPTIGNPQVAGARVTGEILGHGRDQKLTVYKFRRRKNYRRKNGHRQSYTAIKIKEVLAP
jgi:large subunit ribosomal protein L21